MTSAQSLPQMAGHHHHQVAAQMCEQEEVLAFTSSYLSVSGNLNQQQQQQHQQQFGRNNLLPPVHPASVYATNQKYNSTLSDNSYERDGRKLSKLDGQQQEFVAGSSSALTTSNPNQTDQCHERMNKLRERLFRILSKVPIQVAPIQQLQPDGSKRIVSIDEEPLVIKYYGERHMRDILDLHFESSLIKHNHDRGLKHYTGTLPYPIRPPSNGTNISSSSSNLMEPARICWSAVIQQQQQQQHNHQQQVKFEANNKSSGWSRDHSKRQQIISYSKHQRSASSSLSSIITKDNNKLNGQNQSATGTIANKRAARSAHSSQSSQRQRSKQMGNSIMVGSTNLKRTNGLENLSLSSTIHSNNDSGSSSQQQLQQQQQDTYTSTSTPAGNYTYHVAAAGGCHTDGVYANHHHHHQFEQQVNVSQQQQPHNYLYDHGEPLYAHQQLPVNFESQLNIEQHPGDSGQHNQLVYGVSQSPVSIHYYHHGQPANTCEQQTANNYYQTNEPANTTTGGTNSFDPMGLVNYATQLHLNGGGVNGISGNSISVGSSSSSNNNHNQVDCNSSESRVNWQQQQDCQNSIETLIVSHHHHNNNNHHQPHNHHNNHHNHHHQQPVAHLQMIEVSVTNNANNLGDHHLNIPTSGPASYQVYSGSSSSSSTSVGGELHLIHQSDASQATGFANHSTSFEPTFVAANHATGDQPPLGPHNNHLVNQQAT